jgi:putative transposase
MPYCDTPAMQAHLHEISAAVAPGAHAVLILDQAGWHLSSRLVVPDNITLLPLPPRSPELNPVENVWQFLRDNWLSNRVFRGYDDIVAHCCEAWNELIDQPWRIKSIGRREWAHGFDQRALVLGLHPAIRSCSGASAAAQAPTWSASVERLSATPSRA